jgi:hypothetical protein
VQDIDITDGHTFPHKVEVDLNMLHALVLNEVGRKVNDADVVTVDEGALHQQSLELLKYLPQPASLRHAIGHGPVLGLGTRSGDDVLTLQRPGYEIDAEEHSVVRGGLMCVQATRPIHISVDLHLERGRALQKETKI